jgi:anti-sigma factor ChrR (cupin superfamily)
MEINADFTKRVLINSDELDWVASPMPGVDRRMLDRIGGEVARATSIVRYAPNSHFAPHTHGGGEEFIVLEGVFQDEHGDYPAGTYVRNPPTSRHTPRSATGCVIFVKLWQFDPDDRMAVVINTTETEWYMTADRPDIKATTIFKDAHETVQIEQWAPGAQSDMLMFGGAEILILEGSLIDHNETLRRGGWLRIPAGGSLSAGAGGTGARLWIKTGHLRSAA